MTATVAKPPRAPSPGDPGAIILDPEFAALYLPLPPEERQRREGLMADRALLEPLAVWRDGQRLILLTGYDVFGQLCRDDIPFLVTEQPVQDREQARLFIVAEQVQRQHLPERGVSYLRGLLCGGVPGSHGGDRKSVAAKTAVGNRPAVAALAARFGVSETTIYRDVELAAAVHAVVVYCGEGARDVLLGREHRISRKDILHLAGLPEGRQRELVRELAVHKRLPGGWRNSGGPLTICLPRALAARAAAIRSREGRAVAVELARLLLQAEGGSSCTIAT
jgi:hypothetical protein